MPLPSASPDAATVGVGILAVLGGIAKGVQWRDTKTGAISWPLLIGGIATALVMAAVVRATGVYFGIEPWIQVAGSGVLCYVGPDPILKAIANMAMKHFGIPTSNNGANDANKP